MIKRRILELLLGQIEIARHGGGDTGDRTRHLVRIILVWPRMAIANKTFLRAVVLHNGVFRPDPDSWTDSVVFKEAVEGPFGVRVEVSDVLSESQWSEAVARLGHAVWTMAGAHIVDFAENPVTAMLWKAPFDGLARTVTAAAKTEPRTVAAGRIDLQCESWKAIQQNRFEIEMQVPEDIVRVSRRRVGGKLQSRRTLVLKDGEPNGAVELVGRVYV